MPRPGPIKFTGVNALAKEIGRTSSAVSVALGRGKTPDQIRETARRTDERRMSGQARGKQAGGSLSAQGRRPDGIVDPTLTPSLPPAPSSYVPSRRATVSTPRAVLVPGARVPIQPAQSAQSAQPDADTPAQSPDHPSGYVPPVVDENGIETAASADRRKAIALANERELDVAKKRKELLPVKELNAWFAGCIVACRNGMLRIGPELCDRLAAETDPVVISGLINAEVIRVLAMLKELPVE